MKTKNTATMQNTATIDHTLQSPAEVGLVNHVDSQAFSQNFVGGNYRDMKKDLTYALGFAAATVIPPIAATFIDDSYQFAKVAVGILLPMATAGSALFFAKEALDHAKGFAYDCVKSYKRDNKI